MSAEERMAAALKPFGWEMGPEFWRRYHQDPWVFNLANAVERQHTEIERLRAEVEEWKLRHIEARNPGIDMEKVKESRRMPDPRAGCDKCGTDHEGYPAGSFGAKFRCLRAQAEACGAGHLVDQADSLADDVARRRDERLREEGLIPDDDA